MAEEEERGMNVSKKELSTEQVKAIAKAWEADKKNMNKEYAG